MQTWIFIRDTTVILELVGLATTFAIIILAASISEKDFATKLPLSVQLTMGLFLLLGGPAALISCLADLILPGFRILLFQDGFAFLVLMPMWLAFFKKPPRRRKRRKIRAKVVRRGSRLVVAPA